HTVEANCHIAWPGRQNRFNLVVDLKAYRDVEAYAKTPVQKGLPTNKTLLRTVTVEQPINAGEKVVTPGITVGSFRTEGARMATREFHTLRCVRMARKKVEALVGIGIDRAVMAVSSHRFQESRRRIRIITSLSEGTDTD